MQSNTTSTTILKAIGIEVWRERTEPPIQKFHTLCYALFDQKQNVFGYVITQSETVFSDAEKNLVQKIAASVAASIDFTEWSADNLASTMQIIVLGMMPHTLQQEKKCSVIRCASAQAMLENPSFKTEAWQQLKPIALQFK